jgi:DNA-binding Lrp family transcriptional regulator
MNQFRSQLDAADRAILKALQGGLPMTPRPYHAVAESLGMDPAEVMARLHAMQASGVIRRVGAVPNHYKLGIRSNGMTVWDVSDGDIAQAGREVGALDFVSHCYHRPRHLPDWPYNLFAMVHGRDRAETEARAEEIARVLGARARAHEILYSTKILKKTGLRLL